MREHWSYEKNKRFDKKGMRWHFVFRDFFDVVGDFEELPYELYFRNDDKTEFGLLRFEQRKDNPYRDYEAVVFKIMNNIPFRKSLLKPETADFWKRNWK